MGNDKVRLPFHTKSVVTRSRGGTFGPKLHFHAQLRAIGKGLAIGKHTRAGDAAKVELGDRGSISETRSTHPRTHTRESTRAAIAAARLTARPCTGKKQHSPLSAERGDEEGRPRSVNARLPTRAPPPTVTHRSATLDNTMASMFGAVDFGFRPIRPDEDSLHFQNLIKVRVSSKGGTESHVVCGTVFGERPRLVRVDDMHVDIAPEGGAPAGDFDFWMLALSAKGRGRCMDSPAAAIARHAIAAPGTAHRGGIEGATFVFFAVV